MITVDPALPDPPYDQIKRQLTAQVAAGVLVAGDKLPTVRRLATELGLAPNTVARAYRELEASGLLDTRGRAGTFVTGDQVRGAARRAAADYAQQMRALGVPCAEALEMVRRILEAPA